MEMISVWQGRKYWYVNGKRVNEIHITHGNVSTTNLDLGLPGVLEVLGVLRIENGVAYIEGY